MEAVQREFVEDAAHGRGDPIRVGCERGREIRPAAEHVAQDGDALRRVHNRSRRQDQRVLDPPEEELDPAHGREAAAPGRDRG